MTPGVIDIPHRMFEKALILTRPSLRIRPAKVAVSETDGLRSSGKF